MTGWIYLEIDNNGNDFVIVPFDIWSQDLFVNQMGHF
jgi:hypothetical protein